MKQILTLAFIACLLPGFAQSSKDIRKHNVKSITETNYDYSSGFEESQIDTYQQFNKNGDIIELKEFKDGKLKTHEKYDYDVAGNKIKQIEYDDKGKIDKIVEYKYSSDLRTERIVYYPNGKVKNKKVYKYEYFTPSN